MTKLIDSVYLTFHYIVRINVNLMDNLEFIAAKNILYISFSTTI